MSASMQKVLKKTADGSHTLYVPELDETYHSVHGSIQEAEHVFIEAGLNFFEEKSSISILEIGFGTGLNAFLTCREAEKNNIQVNYVGIEAYPLGDEIISKLNYLEQLNLYNQIEQFNKLHQSDWGEEIVINKNFTLTKLKVLLQDFSVDKKFDLIYFDAFGPNTQEEMWSEYIFKKMYDCLNDKGILVTYCAKGVVKRTIKKVGFMLESLPGPPGKREMTRAIKL